MVTSPKDRFRAFVMRHIKHLGCDVYEGVPHGSPYPHTKTLNLAVLNPYVVINHAGVKDNDLIETPGLESYEDAHMLLQHHITRYVRGVINVRRIVIRTPPEIVHEKNLDLVSMKASGQKKYYTYVRMFADDGVPELAKPSYLVHKYGDADEQCI